MEAWKPRSFEDAQQDETGGSSNGEKYRENSTGLIQDAGVGYELPSVSQPPLRQESKVKEDYRHGGKTDE